MIRREKGSRHTQDTCFLGMTRFIGTEKTKKFVMWMKIMGKDGIQFMTVATSDQITGPYRIVNEKIHPGGMNSGDFDLVKREDGSKFEIDTDTLHIEVSEINANKIEQVIISPTEPKEV